jgi:hypothetical protein
MSKGKHIFSFVKIAAKGAKETFHAFVTSPEGVKTLVGTIIHFWIEHMEMMGWEAIASDGHRAVHKHRWQAAQALIWDGKGYPFPFVKPA